MYPLGLLLTIVAVVVAIPALVLGAECFLALFPLRSRRGRRGSAPPLTAVLVPAHDEEQQIGATLRRIQPQLAPGDRLIVIADNCTDATANVARAEGAEVLERCDPNRRAKGYALRFALEELKIAPPEVVVVIDADCLVDADCLGQITRRAAERGRPVQAAYWMQPPECASGAGRGRVSAFAVLVKNFIRPRGLQAIGMPCLINGSGVAYPWEALASVPHPESHIAEDMTYSIDLAIAGYPTEPHMLAHVVSPLPSHTSAFVSQRTRWVHGHLSTIFTQAPRLFVAAFRSGRPSLLALLLELSVPPLSLLVLLLGATTLVTTIFALGGGTAVPLTITLGASTFAALGLLAAWARFGRETLPPRDLLAIPFYFARKIAILGKYIVAPQQKWVRTQREPKTPSTAVPEPHFASRKPASTTKSTKSESSD